MPTRLLLADDSITIQKVVSLTFAAEDVRIESVADGNLALERVRAMKPDIVLADVFMPGTNGYEVCAAIKSDSALADIPVVLLVGTFEPFDEGEASRAKCDAYLTKPFDTAELIRLVHDLVAKREMQGDRSSSRRTEEPGEMESGTEQPRKFSESASHLVSARARESFLGHERILDLFEEPATELARVVTARVEEESDAGAAAAEPANDQDRPLAASPQIIRFPGARNSDPEPLPIALTDEMMDLLVEKVIRKMSQEIIREIAWEVVPELSEVMIRQYLDELNSKGKG